MVLTASEASIFSTVFEGILYGVSVLMFVFTMYTMLHDRKRRGWLYKTRIMLGVSCVLMVFATAEMIVNLVRLRQGYLSIGPHLSGGPERFFGDVSQPTFIIKSVFYNTQNLIFDFAVIYRAYIVWNKVSVIAIPALGWCGLLVACFGTNWSFITASTHAHDVFAVETGRWITANWSMTLVANFMATSLLAYRIWTVKKATEQFSTTNTLTPLLRVVIESGAIYSMTVACALIAFVSKSYAVFVLLDMLSPIISIVYNMILVKVSLGRDHGFSSSLRRPTTASAEQARDGLFGVHHNSRVSGAIPLAVEITQFIESDRQSIPSDGSKAVTVPIELRTYPEVLAESDSGDRKERGLDSDLASTG